MIASQNSLTAFESATKEGRSEAKLPFPYLSLACPGCWHVRVIGPIHSYCILEELETFFGGMEKEK